MTPEGFFLFKNETECRVWRTVSLAVSPRLGPATVGVHMQRIWRTLAFFRADWSRMALAFALLLLTTGAALLKPWPLAWIVDLLTASGQASAAGTVPPAAQLLLLVGALAGVQLLHAALSAGQQGLVIHTGLRGLARVRGAVFDWLLQLSMRRLLGTQAGDLIYRATWDTYAFQTWFTQGVFTLLAALLNVTAMTAVMWRLNLTLTLVALATIPVLLVVMQRFGEPLRRRAEAAQQADASLAASVQQLVANLPLIQSFTREPDEARRFRGQSEAAFTARWAQHRQEVVYLAVVAGVFALGTAAIVAVGSRQVLAGALSVGQLLVFIGYLTQLYEPLNQLSHVGATVTNARAGIQRVLSLLGETPVVADGKKTIPAKAPGAGEGGARVEFDEVSFGYEADRPVLADVSFTVGPGEAVAIIGPSGAGKTTLLQLVPRFLDPEAGVVRVNGVDLRECRVRSLRELVALVPQEPLLLPATVGENIAYGRAGAMREEIEAAARAANAHEFIARLPKGYDTVVGDGAARLSVGEKQRLNLARAFLKDAPILLLDEPTSALDAESEALVVAGLRRLMRGRTTLMVAHRLATIREVGRVVVLDAGRVLESGAPAELLARGGYFAKVSRSE